MKIALIVPNYRWCKGDQSIFRHLIPYNLYLLAQTVKDPAEVTIIDAYADEMDEDTFAAAIERISPDIAGVTVMMDIGKDELLLTRKNTLRNTLETVKRM
ncbi:MAG: hypothetical protein GY854_30015 [Deltaproteobacteria bacterium]|nr:hypothetical protein [Deltaproteobacteria bacterium]